MKHGTVALALSLVLLGALALPSSAAPDDELHYYGPFFGSLLPPVSSSEAGPDFDIGVLTFGVWQSTSDTISSKFLEYRDIPQGGVAPFFRLQGKKGDYRYDLLGRDVTQKDQRYRGRFEGKSWSFRIDYTGIPHRFGNGGRSILIPAARTDDTEWRISDTLQETFQNAVEQAPSRGYDALLAIVQPTLDTQPTNIDIKLQRNRTNLSFSLTPEGSAVGIDVSYFHERRSGARTNNGTSFGFFNVIETAEPIRYITQDFGIKASTRGAWGVAFAGLTLNRFTDRFDTFGWDNPFRATDSTDPRAYLGPTLSTNGPATGLAALPPDNEAWLVSGGTNLFLGTRTRLSADVQVGRWEQNEDPFIPFTTNTAILTPSGEPAHEARLPATALDGRIDVLAVNGYLTSRVADNVRLNARYRFYENDNKTPRLRFEEGYVRFDAVWEEIPRITVPYGFDSNYLDVYGTVDLGRVVGLEVGYKWSRIGRVFRETEHTTENTVRGAADFRFGGGLLVRALYELGRRDFDAYDAVRGEEQSFLDPSGPANQTVLRRYDQAARDRLRFGTQVQWTPESGVLSVGASYYLNRDEYDDTPVPCEAARPSDLVFCSAGLQEPLGLRKAEYETFSFDLDVSPTDRATFYGFYSREDVFNFQLGRESGAVLSFDPANNWTSTVDDTVDSVGAGASFVFVPDRWFFDLLYRFQKADGSNVFTAGSALRGPETPAQNIDAYDDTRLSYVSAQVRHKFARAWTLAIGGLFEDYEIDDVQTGSVLNYMPGSFFINADNGNFRAWVGWVNVSYAF